MEELKIYPHVSVDCVVFGLDGNHLSVLLVERSRYDEQQRKEQKFMKLPGSLIYGNETLDDAVQRVLKGYTGCAKLPLKQFKSFSDPFRTSNQKDVMWLENTIKLKIGRIITVAYISLCKVNRKLSNVLKKYDDTVQWVPVTEVPLLPFDHNQIIVEAREAISAWVENDSSIVFELLPSKFTISQLRTVYEVIFDVSMDVRNFYKRIAATSYIVPLEEKETEVSHRAARYYKFSRALYNRSKQKI